MKKIIIVCFSIIIAINAKGQSDFKFSFGNGKSIKGIRLKDKKINKISLNPRVFNRLNLREKLK